VREGLTYILNHYNASDLSIQKEVDSFIRNNISQQIISECRINTGRYFVKGAAGAGNRAEVPWIAVFDKDITESAQHGYYIVYLFNADMSGIHLSLNQGFTYYKEKYGASTGRKKAAQVAANYRSLIHSSLNNFPDKEINLYCNGPLGKGYEAANVCSKFYPIHAIPENIELISDLHELMGIYRELKSLMGKRTPEQLIDTITSYQENLLDLENPLGQDEERFQQKINIAPLVETAEEPQPKPSPLINRGGREYWGRDARKSKEAIHKAQYKCEFNPSHETFISDKTGKNYMEAHHLIPINKQDLFENSLDVPGNIVSLCPNCHRRIHHAEKEDKKQFIRELFKQRTHKLKAFGIYITLEELFIMYNL
jgi:5-methylcytosine-specific restriction protein A